MTIITDLKIIREFDKLGTWIPIDTDTVKEPEVTDIELRLLKTRQSYLDRI